MERKCKNCGFCAKTNEGVHLCLLGANEFIGVDHSGNILAGVVTDPESECRYPPNEDYISFTPRGVPPLPVPKKFAVIG